MTSAIEFQEFLADLDVRRARLIDLAGAGADPAADRDRWAADLRDLAGKLLVADEEMRVQQEELQDVADRLRASVLENEAQFQKSRRPQVISDPRGKVLRMNTAADQFVRRRPDQLARPVASWFQVSDRGRIRAMIGRMDQCTQAQHAGNAVLAAVLVLPDGGRRTVMVAVATATNARTGAAELRWELRPPPEAAGRRVSARGALRPGPTDPGPESDPKPLSPNENEQPAGLPESGAALVLAEALAAVAERLSACPTLDDVLREMLAGVFAVLPDVHGAAVTLPDRDPESVAAWSGDAALACEGSQLGSSDGPGQGPGPLALAEGRSVISALPEIRQHWPHLAEVAVKFGVRQIMAVPIWHGKQPIGNLTLYSTQAGTFGATEQRVAALVASSAAVILVRLDRERHLQIALQSRQNIGQAVGILMERHKILPEAAFDRLVAASQHRNLKVRELAEIIVQTGQEPQEAVPGR